MSLIRNRNFVRRADKEEGREREKERDGERGRLRGTREKREPVISARLEAEARLHAVTHASFLVRTLFRRLHPSILGSLFPRGIPASRAVQGGDENADGQPSDVLFARLSSLVDLRFVSPLDAAVFNTDPWTVRRYARLELIISSL